MKLWMLAAAGTFCVNAFISPAHAQNSAPAQVQRTCRSSQGTPGSTGGLTLQDWVVGISSSAVAATKDQLPKFEGIVVDPRGYAITTATAVAGTERLHVLTCAENQTVWKAALVVGVDHEANLAVIQVMLDHNLSAARLGNSDSVAPGDIVQVGPSFLSGSDAELHVTSSTQNVISLNPPGGGNKAPSPGAPILNARGEIIGMSLGYDGANNNEGPRLIPANRIASLYNQIIAFSSRGTNSPESIQAAQLAHADALRRVADEGDAVAQFNLGNIYEDGQGVAQDYAQAATWYRKAAEQGLARAQASLGFVYEHGRGVAKDYAQAAIWYQKAADQGDASAQNNLGNLYWNGQGVAKDQAQAAICYRKAADQGFADAQDSLGFLYLNGQGVAQDHSQSASWFRKAAVQGFASAQTHLADRYWLGEGVVKDYEQAAIWNRKAAEQAFARAQNNLGFLYQNGQGVTQDYAQAAIWYQKAADQGYQPARDGLQNIQTAIAYRKAAEQGDAVGQNNLGYLYEHGKGVPQDYAQAAIWYQKAAEQGYATAQENLGDLYSNGGQGVDRDYAHAAIWYRKAADQGLALAQTQLAEMYQKGHGVPQDSAQALFWYEKAADQGSPRAQNNLGDLYYNGQGVAQDYGKAKAWYRKAAAQGDEYAKDQLESLQADRLSQDNSQAQVAMEKSDERQQRIAGLQGDIETLEEEASRWDASAEQVSNNTCSGAGAALCNGISTFGAAKARQNAAKARREAQADREEIRRLLNLPVQHVHIDTSYGAGLQKQTDAHPIATIQDTADQQIAAIHAIGNANAAQQQAAAQQRLTAQQQAGQRHGGTQVQGTGDKFHCVGASGADSGYNNDCQLVQGTDANGGSGIGTGGNSPAGVVGTTGSGTSSANSSNGGSTGTASHSVAPLSASCIGQFWDPKYYNWLSFQNNCGQAIHLTYAGGISGATDDLGPGQATNTGWSKAEMTQKGVFNLYVCPAGYVPVDSSTDHVVNRTNQTFICKQQ